jgi:hypothetical protein
MLRSASSRVASRVCRRALARARRARVDPSPGLRSATSSTSDATRARVADSRARAAPAANVFQDLLKTRI